MNPSIVLRAGTQPVQRPNGSGAGFKALVQDILAGNNSGTNEVINFSRASSTQSTTATLPGGRNIDQIGLATRHAAADRRQQQRHAVCAVVDAVEPDLRGQHRIVPGLERPAHQRGGGQRHDHERLDDGHRAGQPAIR